MKIFLPRSVWITYERQETGLAAGQESKVVASFLPVSRVATERQRISRKERQDWTFVNNWRVFGIQAEIDCDEIRIGRGEMSAFINCLGVGANENSNLEKNDKKEDQRDAKNRSGSSWCLASS